MDQQTVALLRIVAADLYIKTSQFNTGNGGCIAGHNGLHWHRLQFGIEVNDFSCIQPARVTGVTGIINSDS